MRMAKRIAVGLLTAVMALSLLTACGGGNDQPAPSENQGGGSNNSSNEEQKPEEKPEDDGLNGLEDGSTIELQQSRTYKLLQQMQNANSLYYCLEGTNNGLQEVAEYAMLRKDGVIRAYGKEETKRGDAKSVYETLTVTKGDQGEGYRLYTKQKVEMKQTVTVDSSESGLLIPDSANVTIEKTTRKVDGVAYYAEVIISEGKRAMVVCYDNTRTPVYVITNPDTANEAIAHVRAFTQAIPSTAIMNVDDWEVYTIEHTPDGTKFYAPDGHEMTVEEVKNLQERVSKN